jgi:predicted TIM-barrel fold metal-dependent hydrolase
MREIVAAVAIRRPEIPVFLHSGEFPIYKPIDEDWSATIGKLLDGFPTTTFVLGHCGWNRPSAALRAALKHPNLYLETSWQPPRVLHRLCAVLGPRRFILGSDFPLFSMRRALRNCRVALTPEEFELVSERNARELLHGA